MISNDYINNSGSFSKVPVEKNKKNAEKCKMESLFYYEN